MVSLKLLCLIVLIEAVTLKDPLHTLQGNMGNQGKIAKNQSGERKVCLHISALSLISREETFIVNKETPFLEVRNIFFGRLS